jgi:tRNA pseudouridine55 synthase
MNGRLDGVLVIDKPAGPTSHDVVARVRRAIGERRVGHTGTLDPAATGVLPLVLGRATRLARFLSAGDKSYECAIRLGFATETGDAEGQRVSEEWRGNLPARDDVERALDRFRGAFLQQPPAFSAKKIDGTRSHRMARRASGTAAAPVLPAKVPVTAHLLEIVGLQGPELTLRVVCSAGFYVRSLAHDLGQCLGVGAHVSALRRTRSAEFTLAQAVPLDLVERDRTSAQAAVVPLREVLPGLAAVGLTRDGVERASHGRNLGGGDLAWGPRTGAAGSDPLLEPLVRLLDAAGELVGIARQSASGTLHPFVVLM